MNTLKALVALFILTLGLSGCGKKNSAEQASLEKANVHFKSRNGIVSPGLRLTEKDMAQWRGLKFGVFIHWGLYAIGGRGEWVMHNEKIPADEYAKLADEVHQIREKLNS